MHYAALLMLTTLDAFCVLCGWNMTGWFKAEAMVLQAHNYFKFFVFWFLSTGETLIKAKIKDVRLSKKKKLHPLGR